MQVRGEGAGDVEADGNSCWCHNRTRGGLDVVTDVPDRASHGVMVSIEHHKKKTSDSSTFVLSLLSPNGARLSLGTTEPERFRACPDRPRRAAIDSEILHLSVAIHL